MDKPAPSRHRLIWLPALLLFAAYSLPVSSQTTLSDEAQQCVDCHDYNLTVAPLQQSLHGNVSNAHGQQCQACHGNAEKHLNDPTQPMIRFSEGSLLSSEQRSNICLNCHQGQMHSGWQTSSHKRVEIACNDCHIIHSNSSGILDPLVEVQTCTNCHTRKRDSLKRRKEHGWAGVSCTGCHNPHGRMASFEG